MKIEIKNFKENPINFFRKIGYTFVERKGEEINFTRAMSQSGYPRFHVFVCLKQKIMTINIHLDQKKITYGQSTRHHGEYENSNILQEEVERIKSFLPLN